MTALPQKAATREARVPPPNPIVPL